MTETDANPTESTTTPPVAPSVDGGGDLAALQAQIDAARQAGGSTATAELVKSLGFDSTDDLAAAITAQREAEQAAMTEAERREQAAQAAERAAVEREAEADKLIRQGVVNMALARAGVAPENLAAAAPLVTLGDDLSDAAADAAVKVIADNPAFASLFGTSVGGPPSGTTGRPVGETTNAATKTAYDRGAEEYRRLHPVKSA